MAAREREIQARLAALTPAEQDRVLAYLREAGGERFGVPGSDLLRFAGIWTAEEAEEIRRTSASEVVRDTRGGAAR
jgi:hypothetical protein